MKQMRNSSKNALRSYARSDAPRPKYGGKMLWGMQDHRIKCRDCNRYASHEALVRHEPNPFNPATEAVVQLCMTHGNKGAATGEVIRIKPFPEFSKFQRELDKWEKQMATTMQEVLL
jgi:hypothetical protein